MRNCDITLGEKYSEKKRVNTLRVFLWKIDWQLKFAEIDKK